MTKIGDKSLKKLASQPNVKAHPSKASKAPALPGATIGKKFAKDEMSVGLGKALRLKALKKEPNGVGELLKKKPVDFKELFENMHDTRVARGLKGAIASQLERVRLGKPLSPADAPKQGIDGNWYAPNGNRLMEVKLSESRSGSSTALVDPLTNQYYVKGEHYLSKTPTMHGPLALPKDAQFVDQEFTAKEFERLEQAANHPGQSPLSPPLFPQGPQHPLPHFPGLPTSPGERKIIEKLLGTSSFDAPAPKPSDIVSETPLKQEHPFSYTLLRLKDDRVVIKKVLTGGFVPAKPGDGSYSQPIAL